MGSSFSNVGMSAAELKSGGSDRKYDAFLRAVPKYLTFLVGIFFLPLSAKEMLPKLVSGFVLTLLLHHFGPKKKIILLSWNDHLIIATNVLITVVSAYVFLEFTSSNILTVDSVSSIPPMDLVNLPLWVFSGDIMFFHIHRFAHRPGLYQMCHKWHHKYRVTNSWSSFVAHPVDHLVCVVCVQLFLPFVQLHLFNRVVSAPILAMFIFGAIVTFVSSHHTVEDKKDAHGTDHLEHHMFFKVNYSNFGYFDKLNGSYKMARNLVEGGVSPK